MDLAQLTARLNRGSGRAAKRIGIMVSHHRAVSPLFPLKTKPVQRLYASFTTDYGYRRSARFGQAARIGIFDATHFQVGDFLVSPDEGVLYVAAMPPLQPILCVKADRTITLKRTTVAGNEAGIQDYGGTRPDREKVLMEGWPASILLHRSGEHTPVRLPGDTRSAWFGILMPAFGHLHIRAGDLITDDCGERYVLTGAELTDMGWRLAVMRLTI
ncbi:MULTISPECIES: hypothetical protein [unclassified Pantoea]|uniref:hypothetical protein n=1 Tax=unclassified Pantoea TaxID=2630326 RepID=UPI00301E1C6B